MLYSAACKYALQAVARIASQRPGELVLLADICAGTDMPRPFVAKVLHRLVRARLLTSSKGSGGGFALAKPAAQIRVRDVVDAIDGVQGFERGLRGLGKNLGPEDGTLRRRWDCICRRIEQEMLEVTLEQVVRRASR